MAITLKRLVATGAGVPNAEVVFHPARNLIRGPSDTGKSHIRDCLWYLLGGDKIPKGFPQNEKYASLMLEFTNGETDYKVERALKGGSFALFVASRNSNGILNEEQVDSDLGELLVALSGAGGRQILRSQSKKSSVTGGDLRHWFILSQPHMISEEATAGVGTNATQRVAAFNLFLTGSDDAAVQVAKSSQEVERINGQLTSAQDALKRAQAGVPSQVTRKDVEDAFGKLDATLSAVNSQYQARASRLKGLREKMVSLSAVLDETETNRRHSQSMFGRFQLLDQKYQSDLQRLGATSEGVALFDALPETDCPLCGTPAEQQLDPNQLKRGAASKYRIAIAAEAGKILNLRTGLKLSLEREQARLKELEERSQEIRAELDAQEKLENEQLSAARVEFVSDPRALALKHSELSAQLASFDESQRLTNEIERLTKSRARSRVSVVRDAGSAGTDVANFAKAYLHSWGFLDIATVTVDAVACDLVINNRPRLSYGAGKRSIFLAAFTVAVLRHAMQARTPHLGLVVLDSPLKAYADPTAPEAPDVPVATVTERFYSWLSAWEPPGQIVVLENEKINGDTAALLKPLQFTGKNDEGRAGFYPAPPPGPP